jgi:hypothetical protein
MQKWLAGRNGFGAVLMAGVCLLAMGVAGRAWAQATPEQRHLLSVVRIWDQAPHNAFTDLVEVDGTLYCVFREGTGHVPGAAGTNGSIRVLASSDGQNWRSVALLIEPGMDLRDPKISRMPDGRLLLLIGGAIYEGERLIRNRTCVSFGTISAGGVVFSALVPVEIDAAIPDAQNSLWLWRVTWHDGVGYGVAYRTRHPPNRPNRPNREDEGPPSRSEPDVFLVSTRNGIDYKLVTTMAIPDRPNETTLRFLPDGEMVAWVRRERGNQSGWIGFSRAPYREWSWKEQSARLGGPDLIVLPDGQLIGVTRGHLPDRRTQTYVARLSRDGAIEPLVTLPSGGDTSYAGLVRRHNRLLVSYYSSHEGRSAIYLATIQLKEPSAPSAGAASP